MVPIFALTSFLKYRDATVPHRRQHRLSRVAACLIPRHCPGNALPGVHFTNGLADPLSIQASCPDCIDHQPRGIVRQGSCGASRPLKVVPVLLLKRRQPWTWFM
jgi:hypothetical protein